MIGRVSVIVPCYRQAQYLADCIASLQKQAYQDWEAIIVDDGSPDETGQVAKSLAANDSRVRLIQKENGGLSSARNAGIRAAQGGAIQFLDADDLLQPDKLLRQVEVLDQRSDIDIVYGGARYFFDGAPTQLSYGMYASSADDDWIATNWAGWRSEGLGFVQRNLFPVCAPLIRRSVIDRVGLFDVDLPALEDWDFWWRCNVLSMKFAFNPGEQANALIRVHSSSMSQESPRMKGAYISFRLKHLPELAAGPHRNYHLDELLRAVSQAKRDGVVAYPSEVVASLPTLTEKLHALIYFAINMKWSGRKMATTLLRSTPWRMRNFLMRRFGIRSLLM